ncbi:MAG TPA: hypothetical protein VK885_07770, partial [Desulfotignum sp.]|nr:hypothetical protein [Desulfotignum sp.]
LTDFESIIASHLADAYVKTGQLTSAMAAYRKALANASEEDADLVMEVTRKLEALEQLSEQHNNEKTPVSVP